MESPEIPDRLVLLLIALLVLFSPVVILGLTVLFLQWTGDLLIGELTLVEYLELYILELLIFVGFSYALYRLVRVLVVYKLPDAIEGIEDESDSQDDSSD